MTMTSSPQIAVVTNLAPNHLDMHKDMAEYVAAKENIYLHQEQNRQAGRQHGQRDHKFGFAGEGEGERAEKFSRLGVPENGVYLKDGVCPGGRMGKRSWTRRTFRFRACTTWKTTWPPPARSRAWPRTRTSAFRSRARLTAWSTASSWCGTLDGVKYYNDSIASSPSRTIAGLHSFDQKLILIAGGYDKHIPFAVLGPEICAHVKTLVLCGATADKIRKAVADAPEYREGFPEIVETDTLEKAVALAREHAAPGDIVTLSPACAAFDQFKNFMVRGETIQRNRQSSVLVRRLP
jgi:UDP-N-acetylmuramoylalanine--D-glutamate ligase